MNLEQSLACASHLDALQLRLSNYRVRLQSVEPSELPLLKVFIAQCEREIAGELRFLGKAEPIGEDMTDVDLLKALGE